MKNVLFILDYYLPNASANGVCVEKVAKKLIENDNKVSLLVFGKDEHNTYMNNDADIYYCCQDGCDIQKVVPLHYYMKWILPSYYPVTERKTVTKSIICAAERIIQEKSIDTVICVHLPIESLIAGTVLKKKYPNLKIVAYMLDSLSGGFLPRHLPEWYSRKRKIKWESRLLKHFDKIILMSSSKAHHEKNCKKYSWYKNVKYLDIPLFVPEKMLDKSEKNSIVYVGTMADGVRTPYYFSKVINQIDIHIKLSFAGKNFCCTLKQVFTSPYIDLIEYGVISHEAAIDLIKSGEVLLNLGNANPNLVPSKIFEYMSMGKPIISTYCSDEDTSLVYLKNYPNVLLIDERNEDYFAVAEELKKFLLNCNLVKIDTDELEKIFFNNMPESVVQYLSKEFSVL